MRVHFKVPSGKGKLKRDQIKIPYFPAQLSNRISRSLKKPALYPSLNQSAHASGVVLYPYRLDLGFRRGVSQTTAWRCPMATEDVRPQLINDKVTSFHGAQSSLHQGIQAGVVLIGKQTFK